MAMKGHNGGARENMSSFDPDCGFHAAFLTTVRLTLPTQESIIGDERTPSSRREQVCQSK